jgi:hypothetical protein
MCRAKNGELLTNKDQDLSRWMEHFDQQLNEREERDQPNQVDKTFDVVKEFVYLGSLVTPDNDVSP